jgi:hypothetical protein
MAIPRRCILGAAIIKFATEALFENSGSPTICWPGGSTSSTISPPRRTFQVHAGACERQKALCYEKEVNEAFAKTA